eukprot:TRINITY_DN2423_c0_g1_i2.p2 TRINITY_DN2423_c0_g1~~TRINITY_DN2423_c0_g1_i2.p2  ORF type:complete len:107 (-),score=30.34 TRINITY_DN2423_c0_g1_i2:390-710(-)
MFMRRYDASDLGDVSLWIFLYVVAQVLLPVALLLLWIAAFLLHFRVLREGADGDEDIWAVEAESMGGGADSWKPKKQRMMRYDHFPPVAYSADIDPHASAPLFNTK